MKKFIKSAFELFKKPEPVIFTEFDDDFLFFIRNKNLNALNEMLKEGYIPNRQIQNRLKDTALASLEVFDKNYREYSHTINETYPGSYIDYSQLMLKPLAFPFLYIMVENNILNKEFIQNFVTSSKNKVKVTPFPFGEKKFQSNKMENENEIFKADRLNTFLQTQNQYLWQDLINPNEDKKTLSEINLYSKNDEHSILFNENSEIAGIILYKLKNPKSSMQEAIKFCKKRLNQEYELISQDQGKFVFLNKFKDEFLSNVKKSFSDIEDIQKKLLFVNYYMNIIGDEQVSAQQVFNEIYNENIISNGKASSILKMLAIIYQKELIVDKNEKVLLNLEKSNFFSYFDVVVKENLSCFKKVEQEPVDNNLFMLSPEKMLLMKQQQLNDRKDKSPNLAKTLEKLRNRNASSSLVEFKIDDLIENKILKPFKSELLLFRDSYNSINKESMSAEQNSFISEMHYEVMNSLSLYIEMKELNIESDTYPQIIDNIRKIVQQIEDIAKEQSINQVLLLNKDKKSLLRKTI